MCIQMSAVCFVLDVFEEPFDPIACLVDIHGLSSIRSRLLRIVQNPASDEANRSAGSFFSTIRFFCPERFTSKYSEYSR
jgi:hypothetical protein